MYVVVLEFGTNPFGLIVDDLSDFQEIVVKPLGHHLKDCSCFAGATIMDDGDAALILDVAGISAVSGLRFEEIKRAESRQHKDIESTPTIVEDPRQSFILFNYAPEERFAVPLSQMARLVSIRKDDIEGIGSNAFIDFHGRSLPLIRLDRFLPIRPISESTREELFVLVPKTRGRPLGILASEIIDQIACTPEVDDRSGSPPGILGTAVMGGRITTFLDLDRILILADEAIPAERDGDETPPDSSQHESGREPGI